MLLLVLRADPELFRTGWFVESVLSATLVVFALRTRLPFTRSRASRPMLAVTAVVALVALLIPYSPIAGLLGFKALPPAYLLVIAIITLIYFASAEVVKRVFYRRYNR